VRGIHSPLSAVLKHYRPEFALNTTLPQKIPPKIYIPSHALEERQKEMNAVANNYFSELCNTKNNTNNEKPL